MSSDELRRVEILARVKCGDLKLVDAAEILGVSYRQTKRLWKRYGEDGAAGLKHGNAGRASNRAKPEAFRKKVLRLIRRKYTGPVGERFGRRRWRPSTWRVKTAWMWTRRRCGGGCWKRGCGAGSGSVSHTGNTGSGKRIEANWCSWTEASPNGWRGGVLGAA